MLLWMLISWWFKFRLSTLKNMEPFPPCSSFLKSSYAAGLLVVFIFICAKPAIKTYLDAGIIIERSNSRGSIKHTHTFGYHLKTLKSWLIQLYKKKLRGKISPSLFTFSTEMDTVMKMIVVVFAANTTDWPIESPSQSVELL